MTFRILAFALLCWPGTYLSAQLSTAAELLAANNCTQAIAVLQPALAKEKDAIAAYTLLGTIYATESCPEYDLQKAYEATAAAYERYRQLDSKEKKRLESKDFSTRDLTQLRSQLIEHFLLTARDSGDPAQLDAFLDTYTIARRSDQDEARRLRDSLYLAQAISRGSVADFVQLEAAHGTSLRENYQLGQQLDLAELLVWLQEKGYEEQEQMIQQFPANKTARHPSIAYFEKTTSQGDEQAYRYFLKLYPRSPLADLARDSVTQKSARRLLLEAERDSLFAVLQQEASPQVWAQADRQLALLLADPALAQRSLSQLSRIPADRSPATVAAIYRPYQEVQTIEAIRIFQERFPVYTAHELVRADIETIKIKARNDRRQLVDSLLVSLAKNPLPDPVSTSLESLEKAIRTMDTEERQATRTRWQALDERYWTDKTLSNTADAYLSQRYTLLTEQERYRLESRAARTPDAALPLLKAGILDRYQQLNDLDSLAGFKKRFTTPVWQQKADEVISQLQKNQSKTLQGLQRQLRPLLQARQWQDAIVEAEKAAGQLRDNADYQALLAILRRDEPEEPRTLLGDASVNTPKDEYTPVLSADGTTLYYCRQDNLEELRVAKLVNGQLVDQEAVPAFIDARENIAPLALTVDGNRLLLFRGGDMYYSDRTREGWSEPVRYPEAINGGFWQGMGTLTPDGNAMIFEAKGRKDMTGNNLNDIDLYITFRNADGTWREALNLGKGINTPERERSPYLHPDTRTLYFSTDGRSGLGGMDVYKTTRLDDTWLRWSEPVHLGRSANTTGDDWGYKITTNGQYAYFAADPDGDDYDDIYQVQLPPEARPQPVTLFSAFVFDSNQKPLEVELLVEDLETGEVVARLRTEPGTGKITATLPNDRRYGLVFEDGQRVPFADNLDLRGVDTSQVIQTDIVLQTVEEAITSGEGITLRNVFFDHDQAILKPASLPELERVAEFIRRNATLRVEINGHTDNDGKPDYNLDLSRRRAEAVRQQLVTLGVPGERITSDGFGEARPVASNDNAAGQARNRRVEIELHPEGK